MAELVLLAMFVAATLYAVLAGADFGAGLIEAFVDRKGQERVDVALAPVWEANHVWLVLLAVLAFVGFPSVYSVVTSYLHIPLLLVLLGIVARGCAFTFRHYDPEPGALERWYSFAFRLGSFLTPLFLGVVVASTASGRLHAAVTGEGFYAVYVAPWNVASAWSTGLFLCALFAFEGAALLAAEHAQHGAPLPYLQIARRAHLCAIASGALVLLCAYLERLPWFENMLGRPLSLACLGLATLLIPVVAQAFRRGMPWALRLATGAQVACILLGFFAAQYPVLVRVAPHHVLFPEAAAPPATLFHLVIALVIGLLMIIPATVYLIRVYKTPRTSNSPTDTLSQ